MGLFVRSFIKIKVTHQLQVFLWGFLFFLIGLIVVLLEKDKKEHDRQVDNSNSLSIGQWIAIFLGIGIVLMIIFFVVLSNL